MADLVEYTLEDGTTVLPTLTLRAYRDGAHVAVHASRHAAAYGHPLLRSKEPGENRAWCVIHGTGFTLPEPPAAT